MKKVIFYIIFILLSYNLANSEDESSYKLSSYEGLHFMIGFMENESNIAAPAKNLEQKIFVSSNYNATLSVKFGTLNPVEYKVPMNDLLSINVPVAYENSTSEIPQKKLVEITSDVPISVYAYSSIPLSSDSYSVIPITNWGTEYIAVSLPNDQYNTGNYHSSIDSLRDRTPRSSQIMVMAAYDNTIITLIPSSLTRAAKQVGQSYEITLNKGDSYLVQSWQYGRGLGDLTGTIVRSDKPVGFLTGHVRTALLQGYTPQPPDSKDHLIEMLMPTSAWGNTFITVPFGTNPTNGDYFKLVAKDRDVIIDLQTAGSHQEIRLNNNTSHVLSGFNQPAIWRASAPVQLAQLMMRTMDTTESFNFDPSLVILPPVEQFVSRILFNTPDESFVFIDGVKYINHYVTIVIDKSGIEHLKLDNELVFRLPGIIFEQIADSEYYWARVEVSAGKHELVSDVGRFSGILFGVGRFDSYAMTLGCSLLNPTRDDDVIPTISVKENCGTLQGTITDEISDRSYGIYYAFVQTPLTRNFRWKIDPVKSDDTNITFTAEPIDKFRDGSFVIDYYDKSGNRGRYTYNYDAINIDFPKDIQLPNIDYNDSVCVDFVIKNNGKLPIDLLRTQITNDSRIKMYLSKDAPFILDSGEEITLQLCLDPKGNSSSFYGKINLFFGCDTEFEILYKGDLIALELDATGIDFGNVQVGKINCGAISIRNRGNADVLIHDLTFDDVFELDTLDIFPFLLETENTLYIPVCFEPAERKDYFNKVYFNNEFNIIKTADITGRGVAPLINSIVYDFGSFRLGSTKRVTENLQNTGNQDAEIIFDGFVSSTHTDSEISKELELLSGTRISQNSDYNLELALTMSDMNNLSIVSSYKTNWDLHPELTITVLGKATLPAIRTQDVNFGSIPVYTEKELSPEIIFSEGNEQLTIDDTFIANGNSESFVIDYNLMKNLILEENNSFFTAIKFIPNRIGFHELTIGIIHDAKINFQRDTTYITIVGNALAPDNYDVDITFDNDLIVACKYAIGKIKIQNNGNKVHLTDISIEKSGDFFVELIDFSEKFLEKDESVEFEIRIFVESGKGGKIRVITTFFETNEIEKEFEIIPVSEKIIIDNIAEIKYAAGDTVVVNMSGRFPYKIDTLTSFNLSLEMKNSHLSLIGENFSLILDENSENLKYNLNISKTKDKLEFFLSEDLINIFENLKWSVQLKFLGLLSQQTTGNWAVNVSDGKCFDSETVNLRTVLDSVCVFDARHVFVDGNIAHLNIYPNPAEDLLRIKTFFPKEINNAKFSIIDNLGINYTLAENVNINFGESYLEFDLSKYSNGTYILKFESEILKKNILFVIIR